MTIAQQIITIGAVRIRNWKELSEQTFSGEDFS